MQTRDLSDIRNDYQKDELDKSHVHPNPILQFGKWMDQAIEGKVEEPTALTLATVSADGRPSARIVLLKDYSEKGFIFYTNYRSRKGLELENNPFAAMVFFWRELERQVRIEGHIEKVPAADSDKYFISRPVESQVSAIVSPQSEVVPDRKFILEIRDAYYDKNPDVHHRPEHWGGYRLVPDTIEFWQGRPGRLHDRIRYSLQNGGWKIERLAP